MFELPANLHSVVGDDKQIVEPIVGVKLRVNRSGPHGFNQASCQKVRTGNILVEVAFVGRGKTSHGTRIDTQTSYPGKDLAFKIYRE